MAEALHLPEYLEGAGPAEPPCLQFDGTAEIVEVVLDLLAAEEVLRVVAPAEACR